MIVLGWEKLVKRKYFLLLSPDDMLLNLNRDDNCVGLVYPGYGTEACWIMMKSSVVFVHCPGAILLSATFVMFVITCAKLCQYQQRRTQLMSNTDARKQWYMHDRFCNFLTFEWKLSRFIEVHFCSFVRFAKLFIVMGLTWIFEIISYFVHGSTQTWYWTGLDILNILRAIGVFVIYVCKPDVLQPLKDSYPSLKCMISQLGYLNVCM